MFKKSLVLSAAVFSAASNAHAGHDHGHWSSNLTHAILALAVVSVAGLGVYLYRRKTQSASQLNKGE